MLRRAASLCGKQCEPCWHVVRVQLYGGAKVSEQSTILEQLMIAAKPMSLIQP